MGQLPLFCAAHKSQQ